MLQHSNILLVDDEINLCRGCQRIFEDEGYTMEIALSGKEGLEKAAHEEFDVIITDLKMPDISGLDLIKEVKQTQPDTPVIMITGYASVPTAVEAMKLGAENYIPKPFEPKEIIDAVNRVIEKAKQHPKQKKDHIHEQAIIDKIQVLEVLDRTSRDMDFWADLIEKGSEALKEYHLSSAAKAAIISGDINWVKKNVGALTDKQLKFLLHRLELEKW